MPKLAIIGTAGRGDDGKALSANVAHYYGRMLDAARKVAELTGSKALVSGGASYADHVAVTLFLENPNGYTLELELPERLDRLADGKLRYFDKGTGDFKQNPDAVSNHYHKRFGKVLGRDPFDDFRAAQLFPTFTSTVTFGFHARNLVVAQKADHLLAMTFGTGNRLKDGGTAHTTEAFLARRNRGDAYHLDLNTLKLWPGAVV